VPRPPAGTWSAPERREWDGLLRSRAASARARRSREQSSITASTAKYCEDAAEAPGRAGRRYLTGDQVPDWRSQSARATSTRQRPRQMSRDARGIRPTRGDAGSVELTGDTYQRPGRGDVPARPSDPLVANARFHAQSRTVGHGRDDEGMHGIQEVVGSTPIGLTLFLPSSAGEMRCQVGTVLLVAARNRRMSAFCR
jgi:hypothetical protein